MTDVKNHPRWDFKNDKAMAQAVRYARIPLCITDPNLPDNPIVFANAAFFALTGYAEEDVIGQNCRFLQGEETTPESVAAVRRAIQSHMVETVEIMNYRKDGSKFLNALQLGPILDDDGKLLYFFGSQLDVTAKREAERRAQALAEKELMHRLRNIVNVMGVVIRMSTREETDAKELGATIDARLRSLSDAHFQTINRPEGENLTMEKLAQTILSAYAPSGAAQLDFDGPEIVLPSQLVSCIALGLHELATNSVKYGALGAETGQVRLRWDCVPGNDGGRLTLDWAETGGPKVIEPKRRSGSKIVYDLFQAVGGSIDLDWQETGLAVRAHLPL